ncbi:MAG: hypothetical protein LW878_00625 [Proteobacteria bacterium]|nr:hypothetical protein [Pseudomonadota bacterium]
MFILLWSLYLSEATAQITDASFFPAMRSINPGVAHLRKVGFLSVDVNKKDIKKQHDVTSNNILGGIKTDTTLTKGSLFWGGKGGGWITPEVVIDSEKGEQTETIRRASDTRVQINEASSTFHSFLVDFRFFGVSYSGANYAYLNKFRIGTPPDVNAFDVNYDQDYKNIKVGTALAYRGFRLGGFVYTTSSQGQWDYTYYDPTTGNQGTTENFPVETTAKGYGVGFGYTHSSFRFEASREAMTENKLTVTGSFPRDVSAPDTAQRTSMVLETRFKWFSAGIRYRLMKGNYYDLEDIISSNLLYGNLTKDDERDETSFNFALGSSKGLSFSASYSISTVKGTQEDPILLNDELYPVKTTSTAMGVNVSYVY